MELRKERTARKRHRCEDFQCKGWIEPGQRYVDSALTPNDNDIGNLGWWHAKVHLPGEHAHQAASRG
jgi:hypothetical protein